jgi:hypothetical protein
VLLALAACGVCRLGGWRGTDWAAQVYRAGQASHWPLAIWDPGWYGGTYPLNYSLVYPPVAGYLGLWAVAALSAAGAAFCFDRLTFRHFGRRPAGSWYFAVSTVIEVAIGQLPTLAGEALALGAVLCLVRYLDARGGAGLGGGLSYGLGGGLGGGLSYGLGGGLGAGLDGGPGGRANGWARGLLPAGLAMGALSGLASPVVGAFLGMALVAWALSDLGRAPARQLGTELLAGVFTLVCTAALPLLFPGPGYFPFGFGDLVVTVAICGLLACPLVVSSRAVRVGAVVYAAASVGVFALRTPVGDNDTRLAAYIGVPLAICYLPEAAHHLALGPGGRLRRWAATVLPAAVAASMIAWHWSPALGALDAAANGSSSNAAYYEPLIAELASLSRHGPVRVEIPPTAHHWESAYVAPRFALARGWERQLDIAYDPLFYQAGPLTPSEYRTWLVSNGVSFVALAGAPLDYAATAEAKLLRSGEVKGLRPVWHSASWQLWKVVGSQGLASGPATIVSMTPRSVEVRYSQPGQSTLRLRWSPYWSLAAPGAREACLRPAAGGWTELASSVAGQFRLTMSVLGPNHGSCPVPGGVRSGLNGP